MGRDLGDESLVVERVGKKAGNLHLLRRAGFRVPPGFVLLPGDAVSRDELTEAIERIGGFPVAVRSSGVLEDLAGASFAGQYETYLHVRSIDELVERIEQCRDSARAERVVAYLEKNNLDPKAAGLAVLVQRMIEPKIAGVAFSVHPLTGREEHALVEACEGVGERLVSGQVTPSSFTLELRTGRVVEARIEEKNAVLSDKLAREFAETLLAIQAHFGRPQDVEWAVDEHDVLWVLQSRPITTMAFRTDLGLLSSSNMREGGIAARVCYPFVKSLIGGVLQESLTYYLQSVHLFGAAESTRWMHLLYGRPYWSTRPLKDAMARLPGFDERAFDRDMGIQREYGDAGPARTAVSAKTVANALPTVVEVKRWYRRNLAMLEGHRELFESRERALLERAERFAQVEDASFARDLRASVDDVFRFNERVYLITGYTNHSAQRDFHATLSAIDKATGVASKPVRLMGGLAGIFHLDVNRDLSKLVDVARAHGTRGSAWDRAVGAFFARNWFHGDAELDVSVPRWSEIDGHLEALVQGMIASGTSLADAKDRNTAQVREYEDERQAIEARLARSPWLRVRYGAEFRRRLARMRLFLRRKEELRELSTRSYFVVRKYVLEAGRRMAAKGLLGDASEVFFFEVDELLTCWANGAPAVSPAMRDELRHRALRYRGFRDFDPPAELGTGVAPAPSGPAVEGANVLRGVGCSPGRIEGPAKIIRSIAELGALRDGDILVTRFTDPGWTPALGMVRGIVTEVGGTLSHAAVIGREYGIPAVLNVRGATEAIRTGQRLRIDGAAGTVEILGDSSGASHDAGPTPEASAS